MGTVWYSLEANKQTNILLCYSLFSWKTMHSIIRYQCLGFSKFPSNEWINKKLKSRNLRWEKISFCFWHCPKIMRNKVYLSKPHKKKCCQCQSVILATLVSKLKLCTVNVIIVMQSIMKIAKTLTKPCHDQFNPIILTQSRWFSKTVFFLMDALRM